jgi:choline dehydrogenase
MTAATRIVFDESKKAVAVEYVDRNTNDTFQVGARKEVILAAGAVHTPQLLMLSGIGDKDELDAHGIECVADVPGVGHNFQDHPTLFFINECKLNHSIPFRILVTRRERGLLTPTPQSKTTPTQASTT